MEVQLLVTRKAKLVRQMLVQKERGLFRCCTMWENGRLVSKPISGFCREQSQAVLSETKTKASVQSSCSSLKYNPLEPTGGCLVVTVPIQVA